MFCSSSSVLSLPFPGTSHGTPHQTTPPPIVYTIAGSDSGGGAGLQADLHAFEAWGCHGCAAVTCLTAQNSQAVTAVQTPPVSFLQAQLAALLDDLQPVRAIKIGMLGTRELAECVGEFLRGLRSNPTTREVFVVLDPVMISTSGSRLLDAAAERAVIEQVFPYVDLVTPNRYEAQVLWEHATQDAEGTKEIQSPDDMRHAARDILQFLPDHGAVLIKGGHMNSNSSVNEEEDYHPIATDYLLCKTPFNNNTHPPRLCDDTGSGVWLHGPRIDSIHTHGSGCTLSASIAATMALGIQARRQSTDNSAGGAYQSIHMVDACCLAKAYVTAGIAAAGPLGQGPGPVRHRAFWPRYFPRLTPGWQPALSSKKTTSTKLPAVSISPILPLVDSVARVQQICRTAAATGIRDVQLRIKTSDDDTLLVQHIHAAQDACQQAHVRLWVNDHWSVAARVPGVWGLHLGQEDVVAYSATTASQPLGISTHSFAELAAALALHPTYISLGPIHATSSKQVRFAPQGESVLALWRQIVSSSSSSLVAIGGLNDAAACGRASAVGADCVAVIGALEGCFDANDAPQDERLICVARKLREAVEKERAIRD